MPAPNDFCYRQHSLPDNSEPLRRLSAFGRLGKLHYSFGRTKPAFRWKPSALDPAQQLAKERSNAVNQNLNVFHITPALLRNLQRQLYFAIEQRDWIKNANLLSSPLCFNRKSLDQFLRDSGNRAHDFNVRFDGADFK